MEVAESSYWDLANRKWNKQKECPGTVSRVFNGSGRTFLLGPRKYYEYFEWKQKECSH
jgi:hypothetical protein